MSKWKATTPKCAAGTMAIAVSPRAQAQPMTAGPKRITIAWIQTHRTQKESVRHARLLSTAQTAITGLGWVTIVSRSKATTIANVVGVRTATVRTLVMDTRAITGTATMTTRATVWL